jgi:putative transposase
VLGLSASRCHAWLRLEQACSLDDRTSCPRTIPNQLTSRERASIRQMATAMEYRHMPIRALALYARHIGMLFAAPTTWARLIRKRGR